MSHFQKASQIGTAGAKSLSGRFYTSREIFWEEHERVFAQRWLCVGREEKIRQAGEFFTQSVGPENILILRDRSGELRAFYNVCRHRGTRLCSDSQGQFARAIRCPYHAWAYALDGRLLAAPSMDGLADFDRADYPLHAVAVATWEGFIFISLAESPQPFLEAYAPLVGKFEQYNLPQLHSVQQLSYDVQANWKLIFENYSECYHCAPAHPQLAKRSPPGSGENDLVSGPFLGGFMTLTNDGGSLTLSGRACSIAVGEFTREQRQRIYYYSIFPNMLLSLHAEYVMVHTVWPLSPQRTWIDCQWLFHPEANGESDFAPDDAVEFWDVTNRQDWRLCELSQQGIVSRAYTPGPYSPRESISAAFDRELLEALGGAVGEQR